MSQVTPANRRERQRADTVAEIKSAARARLVESGASGFSLRAIARDIGMTAPALYRYFPSLEALVVEMCSDLYEELRLHMVAECDKLAGDNLLGRVLVAAQAFRGWAIGHRVEFGMMFASLTPGAVIAGPACTADSLDPEAEPYASMLRFCRVFGDLFNQIYQQDETERGFALDIPPPPDMPQQLRTEISEGARFIGLQTPFDYAFAFHSCWVRLYGLVTMEVFGQLPIVDHSEEYFNAELAEMAIRLGVPPQMLASQL